MTRVKIKFLVPGNLDYEDFRSIYNHLNEPLRIKGVEWDCAGNIVFITVFNPRRYNEHIHLSIWDNRLEYEFVDAPHWLR